MLYIFPGLSARGGGALIQKLMKKRGCLFKGVGRLIKGDAKDIWYMNKNKS